jgi:hypothetical protein
MFNPDEIRAHPKLSCPCGADIRVDPQKRERNVECPKCGLELSVVVSVDPKDLKQSKLSLVVPLMAVKTEGESLAKLERKTPPPAPKSTVVPPAATPTRTASPGPKSVKGVFAECPCGTRFPVDEAELATKETCPGCKVKYHVVLKLVPGTKRKTAMLVPERGQSLVIKPPSPSGTKRIKKAVSEAPKRGSTKVPRATKVRPLPELPPGAQGVACFCGAWLVVRRKDVRDGSTCPSCGRALAFSEQRDPQTLVPVLKVREAPKP